MKKIIGLLLALTFIIGNFFGADKVYAKGTDSSSKVPFEYVITPKSPEWKNFNVLELKDKLNIPKAEAASMDTETLLKVVLDYPFLGDIYAFNNPLKAIDLLAEQFNGLGVLLQREDLKDKLVDSYINSSDKIMKLKDHEKIDNEERYKHNYRESLLAYPIVFKKLSKTEKDNIISKSKKVAKKIDKNPITLKEPATFGIAAAGDLIRYGTVSTPYWNPVSVMELVDMSASEKASADAYMDSRYPNATRLRSATYKYNCHSYAWYSTSTSNVWWMNYPSYYMTEGSYTQTTAASGRKIFYPTANLQHSGIISSVGSYVQVTSKWGAYGLYSHAENNCPYATPTPNTYWSFTG